MSISAAERSRAYYFPAALLFVSMLLPMCAPSPSVRAIRGVEAKKQPPIKIAALEQQIHKLINKERRRQGLPPLSWDNALAAVARSHSRDMAKRNYFSHYSPEGRDFSFRYKEAGYQCALRVGSSLYLGAENILQNNLYDSVTTINGTAYYDWNTQEKIAETSVQGWMKSPGHRKNILTPQWRKEGIGVVIAPDDKVYITQNFC
jgi:uncharacterized protein YkwD